MAKISKSPARYTFQREGYIRRCNEKGEEPNSNYLDMYKKMREQHDEKFDDPKSRENNLEYDLLTTDWILEKARTNEGYAQNLYAAMCNNEFQKLDVVKILKEEKWSCSWRFAGGIIADMRAEGDYIDWYCSGIRGHVDDEELTEMDKEARERYFYIKNNYVPESVVTDEVRKDLSELGWSIVDYNEEDLI